MIDDVSQDVSPQLSPAWRERYVGAAIGVLAMSLVQNTPPSPSLLEQLHTLEHDVRSRYAGKTRRDLETLPTVEPYVQYYRRFGKTYHVLLQLESVAFRGRSLAAADALVSAMFGAEVDSLLLTAGHDLAALAPPLLADLTRAGERYLGIAGKPIEVKPGDLSIRDGHGILSTVLYGPDQRTRLGPETRCARSRRWSGSRRPPPAPTRSASAGRKSPVTGQVRPFAGA